MMPNSPGLRSSSRPSRMKLGMIETLGSSAGSMALSNTVCTALSWASMPCNWVKGATAATWLFCSANSRTLRQSLTGW